MHHTRRCHTNRYDNTHAVQAHGETDAGHAEQVHYEIRHGEAVGEHHGIHHHAVLDIALAAASGVQQHVEQEVLHVVVLHAVDLLETVAVPHWDDPVEALPKRHQ